MQNKHLKDTFEEIQEQQHAKRRHKKQTTKMIMTGKGMKRFANPTSRKTESGSNKKSTQT